MFHRRSIALGQIAPAASVSLGRLAGIEGFSRSVLVGLAPLLALDALGTKQAVSYVYLAASVFTMMITLNLSSLERLTARRWVVTLGGVFLVLAAVLLFTQTGLLFALGIGMRSAAASIFSVCMSLYIMEYIGKRDLTRNESRRMLYTGLAWLVGPATGLWLWNNSAPAVPFLLSIVAALAMLSYFWYLRLGDNPVLRSARSHPSGPISAVLRYIKQPRLRIAYGITVSRSCFWVALFVYGPIYIIEAGLPVWMAGLLLSGVSGLMFTSPAVRWLSDLIGTRQVIMAGLLLTGLSLLALAVIGEAQPLGIVFWVTAAIGGVVLDVLGNIPFMRSVRPRERGDMTMVFSTWREASEWLTPAIAATLLLFAPFWWLYVILALMHFMSVAGASYLPRRL